MAVGEQTMYSMIAPPEANADDLHKMVMEVYYDQDFVPQLVVAEPLGRDPDGNSVWAVTVTEGPEKAQEAPGGDESPPEVERGQFEHGGP